MVPFGDTLNTQGALGHFRHRPTAFWPGPVTAEYVSTAMPFLDGSYAVGESVWAKRDCYGREADRRNG